MSRINIHINERYYSKDPLSSDLGHKIVHGSLDMIVQLGFEQFTFKKLANQIGSTEASIYRYFENKQKLLIYLTAWYWAWVDYRIDYDTHHLVDPEDKLSRIWEILCHLNIPEEDVSFNTNRLREIVINESDKTYLTKSVDEINKQGLFVDFKALCHQIANIVAQVYPEYEYPHALVSTLIEASHQQFFFASHLPALTEIKKGETEEINTQVYDFIMDTLKRTIKVTNHG